MFLFEGVEAHRELRKCVEFCRVPKSPWLVEDVRGAALCLTPPVSQTTEPP